MSDIFLSYAAEDREAAGKVARAFGAQGWSVWWDRKILAGQQFDQAIERELNAAPSVVVLWSAHSIGSEWVKSEAAAAAKRGVLVPVMLEAVELPLEFSRRQTADLTGWNGDPAHRGFQALREGVAALLGGAPTKQPIPAPPVPRNQRRWIAAALVFLVMLLGYGVYRLASHPATREGAPASTKQATGGELADLAAGTYLGNINADAKGSSRSDVLVTVTRISRTKVQVTSENPRIGAFAVDLTRIGDTLYNVGGDSTFIAYPAKTPPELVLTARGEVSYGGTKTQTKQPAGGSR